MGNKGSTAAAEAIGEKIDAHSDMFEVTVSDEDLQAIWDLSDTDGSGALEEEEALGFLKAFLTAMEKQAIEHADDRSDKKKAKKDYKTLKSNRRLIYEKLLDADGNGEISFDEFKTFISEHTVFGVMDVVSRLESDSLTAKSDTLPHTGPYPTDFVENNRLHISVNANNATGYMVLNSEFFERDGIRVTFEASGASCYIGCSGSEDLLVNGVNYAHVVIKEQDWVNECSVEISISYAPNDGAIGETHEMTSFSVTCTDDPMTQTMPHHYTHEFDLGEIGGQATAWQNADVPENFGTEDFDGLSVESAMMGHIRTVREALEAKDKDAITALFAHVPMDDDDRESMIEELMLYDVAPEDSGHYYVPDFRHGGRLVTYAEHESGSSPIQLMSSNGESLNFPIYVTCIGGEWVQAIPFES